jgi:HNH endonuclease
MPSYIKIKSHYRRVGRRRSGSAWKLWTVLWGMLGLSLLFIYYPVQSIIVLSVIVVLFVTWIAFKIIRALRSKKNIAPVIDTRYIPDELRKTILTRDSYKCCACGSQSYLEMDHIIPLSKGGATSLNNLQTLCHGCNLKKGNR